VTTGNCAKLAIPIVLCVIRYKDPSVKPHIKKMFISFKLMKDSQKRN